MGIVSFHPAIYALLRVLAIGAAFSFALVLAFVFHAENKKALAALVVRLKR